MIREAVVSSFPPRAKRYGRALDKKERKKVLPAASAGYVVGLLHRPGGEGKLKEEEERGLEQKSFKVKREGMGRENALEAKRIVRRRRRRRRKRRSSSNKWSVGDGMEGREGGGKKVKGGSSLSFAQKRGGKWMGWKTPSIPRRG